MEILPLSTDVTALAHSYVEAAILPLTSQADAFHVALSAVQELDLLVSWNYRHRVNVHRRAKLIAHNRKLGYDHPLEIVTPAEALTDGMF